MPLGPNRPMVEAVVKEVVLNSPLLARKRISTSGTASNGGNGKESDIDTGKVGSLSYLQLLNALNFRL